MAGAVIVSRRDLPLGVDIGATRVRVAWAQRSGASGARVVAVASCEVDAPAADGRHDPEMLAAAIEELARETGSRVRRCVVAAPPGESIVRVVRFPKMSWGERKRAAAFEAERICPWDTRGGAAVLRVHAVDRERGLYAVGVARRKAIDERVALLRRSGLRVVGIDHEGCAVRRGFPACDAVLDVGYRRSTLHVFAPSGPLSLGIESGGAQITRAIATELKIDGGLAEKRKRILGTAGAGEGARAEFVARAASAIDRAREATPVRRIALLGNGARLAGLASALEAAAGAIVEIPVSGLLDQASYPDDVVRAAAPDWTLAASLAAWASVR